MFGKSLKSNSLNSLENENEKSKFIFYSENEKQFSHQIELVINLNNFSNKRILLFVNDKNSIKNLKKKIISEFLNFPEFKNISNMKIIIKKKEKENIKILDEKFDEKLIQNFFSNGEILFCDLITNEIWIKINFKLISYDFNKNIKIDFKFNNNLIFFKLKLILIKSGINLFLEQIKNNENFNKNIFYLKNYKFHFLINNKIVYDVNLNNNEIIKNIFEINSEIQVEMNFFNFEEIVFNELKKIKEIYLNKIKFNEFKELNFIDFKNNNNFKHEINIIKIITQEIIKKNIFKKSSIMFFFYLNKNNHFEFNNNNNNEIIENENNISKHSKNINNYYFNIIIIIPFVIKFPKNNFYSNSFIKNKNKKSFISNKFNKHNSNNNIFLKHKQNFLQINNDIANSNSLINDNNNLKDKLLNNQNDESSINIENFHEEKNLDNLSEINNNNNNIINNNFTEINSSFHIFEQNFSKFHFIKKLLKNNSNLYCELYKNFQYEKFYLNLKNRNKNNKINKEMFNNLEIPESKEFEILEKENEFFLFEKPKKKFEYLKVNKYCISSFIILVIIYFLIFIIAVNKEYFLI